MDEILEDEDWIKTLSWDLPTNKDEFLMAIGGPGMLEHFLTLPAAKAMPIHLRNQLSVVEASTLKES